MEWWYWLRLGLVVLVFATYLVLGSAVGVVLLVGLFLLVHLLALVGQGVCQKDFCLSESVLFESGVVPIGR